VLIMLIVSVYPSFALLALRWENQAYDAVQYVTNTLRVNSLLLKGRVDQKTIKVGLEKVSLGNELLSELQELGGGDQQSDNRENQQQRSFSGVLGVSVLGASLGESLRSGKKDLLVADRGKLHDHDVREHIKAISLASKPSR